MDRRGMAEMFREPRAIRALDQNRQLVLFVDNCSGNNETEDSAEALGKINTKIRLLPKFQHN
jgi:hypothetical protein